MEEQTINNLVAMGFMFSDKVVTAYQEGRENDVAFDITDEVIKLK